MDDAETRILGAIQIRHVIRSDSVDLSEVGGHIGYGIRPSERGHGYGNEILRLAIIEALRLSLAGQLVTDDLGRILITCDEDNVASRKVIEANEGVFDRYAEETVDGKIKRVRRYFISL